MERNRKILDCFIMVSLLLAWFGFLRPSDELERWFIPGPFGHEPGRLSDSLQGEKGRPSGFLTRFFSNASSPVLREWERHNKQTELPAFSHNLAMVFPASLYDRHPEFFPLERGERVRPKMNRVNWNPDLGRLDVAAYAAGVAGNYFRANPAATTFSLSINDAYVFGDSPETLASIQKAGSPEGRQAAPNRWFRGRPDYSNLVFTFMNRAAEDLARTYPDKYLGALAYYWVENAPDFPVRPQVLPFLTADRSQGYDQAFRAEEFALQKKWADAMGVRPHPTIERSEEQSAGQRATDHQTGRSVKSPAPRLGMYDYLDGPGFLIPRIHTRLITENIRHAWQVGFTDYYGEGEANWGLDGPMHWLVAQLLQDPMQSENDLLDEYYRRYFQEAAVPMRKFFERCEEQWMHQAGVAYWLKQYRNESQAKIFPSSVCHELRAYLDEAERLTRSENSNSGIQPKKLVAARVRLVSDAFGATERLVTMQEAKEVLNWRTFVKGVPEITNALEAFITARDEFLVYLRDLRVRQPLALAPFELTDYTSHDPVVNALVALGKQAVAFRPSPNLVAKLPRGWELLVKGELETWNEVCGNGWLLGPSLPERRIAGLEYGVALPAPWVSYVQPAEHHRAFFVDSGAGTGGSDDRKVGSAAPTIQDFASSDVGQADSALALLHPRVLRISGTTDTAILQWNRVENGAFYLAQVTMRGSVGPSCAATLTFGWLDAQQHNLGHTSMRLPEGEWREPLVLSQGAFPPPEAAYVGIGVRIEHQTGNDWVEVSDFSLRTTAGL